MPWPGAGTPGADAPTAEICQMRIRLTTNSRFVAEAHNLWQEGFYYRLPNKAIHECLNRCRGLSDADAGVLYADLILCCLIPACWRQSTASQGTSISQLKGSKCADFSLFLKIRSLPSCGLTKNHKSGECQ